jgi:peptide/nickel transport system permease protein
MATTVTSAESLLASSAPKARNRFIYPIKKFFRGNLIGAVGAVIILVLVITAIGAPIIATHDPFRIDASALREGPSAAHWFGTDELGRDLFSRIVYGARISLWVGSLAIGIAIGVGAPLGMAAAFFGGWVDTLTQQFIDALFAFPTIVLGLALVAVMGPGVTQVIIAVGIVNIPRVTRVVRSSSLSVKAMPYVEAATCCGASDGRIVFRHILPNILAPIIIMATAGFATAILAEASLSFLGAGTPPPTPSWGTMLSGAAQEFIRVAPWMAIFPGIAITLAVFAFNLFGDALRDVFDPRLRGSQ